MSVRDKLGHPYESGSFVLSINLHRLIHLDEFDIVHQPQKVVISGSGNRIDALGAEDDDVLALVGRDFDCPVNDAIKACL